MKEINTSMQCRLLRNLIATTAGTTCLLASTLATAGSLAYQTTTLDTSRGLNATLQIGDGYAPLVTKGGLYQWFLNQTAPGQQSTLQAPDEESGVSVFAALNLTHTRDGAQQTQLGGPTQLVSDGPSFDIATFESNLRDSLNNNVVGYSYAINFKKQLYNADANGMARMPMDYAGGPLVQVPQSEYRRMNIASISKNLTAVAVLQLLEKNNLNVNDPIAPWLPAEWTKGYGMEPGQVVSISFRDLLTHTSGLKQTLVAIEGFDAAFKALNKVKWDGLSAMVEYGTMPNYYGDYDYSNVNYALFRVIIPALWRASAENPGVDAVLTEETAAAWYAIYMAQNLFVPLGIHQAACNDDSDVVDRTLFYNANNPSANGGEAGNWTLSCGSGGWVLSAHNLANILANVRYNNAILSPAMRTQMDNLRLGWKGVGGDYGTYLSHGGALYFDDADFPDRREMQGCIMKFPIQVEAVVLVNSSVVDNELPCTKLKNAFDDAWVN